METTKQQLGGSAYGAKSVPAHLLAQMEWMEVIDEQDKKLAVLVGLRRPDLVEIVDPDITREDRTMLPWFPPKQSDREMFALP